MILPGCLVWTDGDPSSAIIDFCIRTSYFSTIEYYYPALRFFTTKNEVHFLTLMGVPLSSTFNLQAEVVNYT